MILNVYYIIYNSGFLRTGNFYTSKSAKKHLTEESQSRQKAYNGKYYTCFLIAQLDFDNPQFFQVVDFSKYDETGIVYLRMDVSDMKDAPAAFGMNIEEAKTPALIGWVELFEVEEGLWKWRQLSS